MNIRGAEGAAPRSDNIHKIYYHHIIIDEIIT